MFNIFYGCTNLSTLTIGKSAQHIGVIAFGQCLQLNDVYCLIEKFENESLHDEPFDPNDFSRAVYKTRSYVETGLNISYDIFEGSYIEYATLHVPASAINTYMTTAPWSGFGEIVPISGEEIPKCATPTISYVNGEITFSCETESVEYVSELSSSDVGNKYTDKVNITGKITVKVYATKSGYDKSDTAIAEIEVPGELKGDLNNDGTVNVADHVELTKIIMNEE